MDNLLALAGIAVLALVIWWWLRRSSDSTRGAETQLHRICLGDRDQVERLINAELNRTPRLSRGEAARHAVLRYQRDNR